MDDGILNIMQTFKFFTDVLEPSQPVVDLTSSEWNFSDNQQAKVFCRMYREHELLDKENIDHKKIQYTLNNYNLMETFTADNPTNFSVKDEYVLEFDKTVAYLDRKKSKTIIALSGGSWRKTLYEQVGLEHTYGWLKNDPLADDYNIVSFSEQLERTYHNPILYDSCYYNGCHPDLDTLEAIADYTKKLFPDNDYYVVADCKAGHSGALLSYYLSSKKCFLHSAITTVDTDVMSKWWANNEGTYHIDLYPSIDFEVFLRATYLNKFIPKDLVTTQSIIDRMPNCEYQFYYHEGDTWFHRHADLIKTAKVKYTSDQKYTYTDHYILPYLRKYNIILDFFNQ